jgi:predicted phage tail protein
MALVLAARFYTAAEGQMASACLASAGIQSFVFDAGINLVELGGIAAPVRLMVDEDELDEALVVLAEDQR